ncbi:MAG TPA: helix-turn-helix transcriptional regulator [Micromonosporaceae bacterium]
MTERTVDREAWARLVAELIDTEAGGNTTQFAKLVGVTYKTVRRWILQETTVSEESIRGVADALHINPGELLVRVGLYQPDELTPPAAPAPSAADDPALAEILEADVPPRVKQRMIQRLQQLRAQEQQRQVDEVRWWIEQSRGA